MNDIFNSFANKVSELSGTSWAFVSAVSLILIWVISGPIYHFSETWQLVMNTITSIITFLMVFLVQNTQNRDTKAIQLKLDELIRSIDKARNKLIEAENLSDEQLEKYKESFRKNAESRPRSKKRKIRK